MFLVLSPWNSTRCHCGCAPAIRGAERCSRATRSPASRGTAVRCEPKLQSKPTRHLCFWCRARQLRVHKTHFGGDNMFRCLSPPPFTAGERFCRRRIRGYYPRSTCACPVQDDRYVRRRFLLRPCQSAQAGGYAVSLHWQPNEQVREFRKRSCGGKPFCSPAVQLSRIHVHVRSCSFPYTMLLTTTWALF